MAIHHLKTDPMPFMAVQNGQKTFEIRFDDRKYAEGDILVLQQTRYSAADMQAGSPLEYTDEECTRVVSHVLRGPIYGLAEGWVLLSFVVSVELEVMRQHLQCALSCWQREVEMHGGKFLEEDEGMFTAAMAFLESPALPQQPCFGAVVLNGHQLKEALEFVNPDGDDYPEQLEDELLIQYGHAGSAGAGYYASFAECPDEGAIILAEKPAEEVPQ